MPKGKKIYEDFSKKYATKKDERRKRAEAKGKDKDGNPIVPASVNNFHVNKPTHARSLNFPQTPQVRRQISKMEGQPTVNASSDVKALIHKPKPKSVIDPAAGAIKEELIVKSKSKSKGRRKKTPKKTG